MRPLTPAFLAAALALTLVGNAAWSNPSQPKVQLVGKVRVALNDLDLGNSADARTLLDRLKQAAWHACGGDPKLHNSYRSRPEQTVKVYEECRENAVKRAIDQIGAPLLARAYAEDAQGTTAGGDCIEQESRMSALARARDQSGT
jgi:UrcA family protein